MKRLLMIPLLAIPTWLYSCTHHTPHTPTPAEVVQEGHMATHKPTTLEVPFVPNPCAHYPCILPNKPPPEKTDVRPHPRPRPRPTPPVATVEAPQELPVVPAPQPSWAPPRCLFWIIGEAGCEPR